MNETAIKAMIMKLLTQVRGSYFWRNAASAFGRAGASDILGLVNGRFVAIEVKTPEAYRKLNQGATASQMAFIANIKNNGGVAAVVCSVEQVRELLIREFGPDIFS